MAGQMLPFIVVGAPRVVEAGCRGAAAHAIRRKSGPVTCTRLTCTVCDSDRLVAARSGCSWGQWVFRWERGRGSE
ncbi:uncharacterized protein B0I36DRAFT_3263 [Microdochium trichocladiopsis]|uniref:Uncharacterized protein n=1 Tax=Microdochium trichocladiopsis TaxID=1682393 RepID=A0A9P8YH87_9PEZI|nr:uncharacterized protein B0I36DRAFT_3263 [Microdochium trichocladiopsis]KAH7039903.1 hypothetical protein B0I36DRAFT_3263 [Microdochium trichocladiopsis]